MDNDSKVEQFVLLAKNARGLALIDLIQKATAEPGLFNFGELLDLPGVQELRTGEHEKIYSLLRLFAYGTWSDYLANSSSLPALSDEQKHKLKLLSAVSLANARRTIAYSDLMQHLEIDNLRQLEDTLISDCIYSGLIKGRLDQKRQCLHVEEAFARDVAPESLPEIVAALGTWLESAKGVADGLQGEVTRVTAESQAADAHKIRMSEAIEAAKENMRAALQLQAQQEVSAMALDEGDLFIPGGDGAGSGAGGSRPPLPGSNRVSKRRR